MANLSNINGKFVVEQTTGYVGVGITDPSYPIEVLNASAEIALNASGGSIYRLRSDSTDSFRINKNGVGDRLVINSAGKVGIGSGSNTLVYPLEVYGGNGDAILFKDTTNSVTNWFGGFNGAAVIGALTDDDLALYAGAAERMRITSSGLTIFKSSFVAATAYGGELNVGGSSVTTFGLQAKYNQAGATQSTLYSSPGYTSNDQLFLLGAGSGNTAQLVLRGNGNVGIGTDSPSTPLMVNRASNSNEPGIYYDVTGGSSGSVGIGSSASVGPFIVGNTLPNGNVRGAYSASRMLFNGGGFAFQTSDETSGARTFDDRMKIEIGGNVGIGTTVTNGKLSVAANDASTTPPISSGIYVGPYQGNTAVGSAWSYSNSAGTYTDFSSRYNSDASYMRFVMKASATPVYAMTIRGSGNIGIGTDSPDALLNLSQANGANIRFDNETTTNYFTIGEGVGTNNVFSFRGNSYRSTDTLSIDFVNDRVGIGTISPNRKLQVAGKAIIGSTANYSSNAGTLHVYGNNSENSGMLDIMTNGNGRYYTRVCYNATTVGQAGYWHIKTNIPVNGGIMFLAKFYGYIYGSAQVLDLQHSGYAYAASNSVINQGTTNNGSNTNASSAIYASANGNKVTFRIAFGAGATFSTYYAGVYMDICFPNPAGRTHDFEIEAQTFNQSGTVY